MKVSALFASAALVAAAHARCTSRCGGGTCLRAIAEIAVGGEAFCSSWLSQKPATSVVVDLETATSTHTVVETSTDVRTLTTATATTVGPTVTVYQRDQPIDTGLPLSILLSCSNLEARVSSACSCVLSTTSTVTVHETSTAVVVPDYTTTTVTTVTSGVTATETATPTRIIPAQPIVNGDFEAGKTDPRNIAPWVNSTAITGGKVEYLAGVNPCTAGPATQCAGGTNVIRVTPPTSGAYQYFSLSEQFTAKSLTTYSLSFYYRCLQYGAASGIDIYYQGQRVGGASACPETAGSAFAKADGIIFTTDASGQGEIEARFLNPGFEKPYLYYYADAFLARAV